MPLDGMPAIVRCVRRGEVAMAATILVLLFTCGIGLVVAARRPGSHAAALERLGGLLLVSGLVGLGYALARSAG